MSRFKKLAAIISVVIFITTLAGTNAPLVASNPAESPKEHIFRIYTEGPRVYGITYIHFPNGTSVYIEFEAKLREIGRNELGTIGEIIPESIVIIKKEVIHKAQCSPPQVVQLIATDHLMVYLMRGGFLDHWLRHYSNAPS